jgi:hypothetical protein
MEIPIKFPHPADVIAAEAVRFRRMSIPEQAREFAEVIEIGLQQLYHNPRRAEIEAQILQSELDWQEAHRRIFQRHGV